MTRRAGVLALLLALLVVPGLTVLQAGPATAQQTLPTSAEVVRALQQDPVYVHPAAEAQVERSVLRAEIGRASRPVYVAVLPRAVVQEAGSRRAVNETIGGRLGPGAILFTVTGSTITGGAGSGTGLGAGEADRIAQSASGGGTTAQLAQAIRTATAAAADGPPAGSGQVGGFASDSTASTGGSGGGAVLALLGLLAAGGGGLFYLRTRKQRVQSLEGDRADVESLYNRLGADVANLHPGDDPVARQALADAAERYTAAGALMSRADTPGEFAAARRTLVEGLTAARLARTRLGVDPGPEVPPPPGQLPAQQGAQLHQVERVRIGDDEFEGSPTYAPGRQHYYGGGHVGGRYVPGGWYGVPFWETALLGGMIGGMAGGMTGGLIGGGLAGGMGGGYGSGYENGYEEGVEDAQQVFEDRSGGGDWGGGGGDWGGGGGDWGGGGGGGDWGGGSGGGNSW